MLYYIFTYIISIHCIILYYMYVYIFIIILHPQIQITKCEHKYNVYICMYYAN